MAVPTVTVISPNTGLTGGRRMVQIMGGNFQLPPEPPFVGTKAPPPAPTVEVLFGGVASPSVFVTSRARLFCLSPKSPLPDPQNPEGAVAVEVRNIDSAGALIPGETVTVAAGFTYALPSLLGKTDFARITEQLLGELNRQVIDNVELMTHTDYDGSPDGANVAELADIPGLALSGPETKENRFYSLNTPRYEPDTLTGLAGVFMRQRPPYTVDLRFVIIGVTDNEVQLLNLMKETQMFFMRNKTLTIDRDGADPSKGTVSYELDTEAADDVRQIGTPNNSNVRAFQGAFVVRGVDLDDPDMAEVPTKELIDVVPGAGQPHAVIIGSEANNVELLQLGEKFGVGPSPGEDGT